MAEEEKAKDVTRRELAEALAKANALIEEQGKAIAELRAERETAPTAALQRELAEARALLAQRSVEPVRPSEDVKLVPYSGLVQATVRCCVGHIRAPGDVFEVSVPALWTDDPYEAVEIIGTKDDGTPITRPNPRAPTPINFRFRKVVSAAEDPTPRRASEY